MVAHGFIAADELARIHAIGLQMDEARPDLALASEIARQGMEADRAARKAAKQAAAAERKLAYERGVAERKATDIVFLGRGVSRGLADRNSDVSRLEALGLPILSTPGDLAAAIGVAIPRLRWLAFHQEAAERVHYIRFTIPKKSGGTRELAAPHRQLAACQAWILKSILEPVPVHAAAHGFVRSRSTVTNAAPHVGQAVVVNADLKDFFPSITFSRVLGLFRQLGYSPAVATILALLVTESPRKTVTYAGRTYHVALAPRSLPQGACTSPAISNLIARRLDARLAGITAKLGWNYTRYADDLSFSTSGETAKQVGYLLARVRHIASDEKFTVNEAKTRVQRRNVAQSVTGIVVNESPHLSRDLVRRLRAILHRAKTEGLAAQNREGREHFTAWLGGMIAYLLMVDPARGQKMQAEFDALMSRS